MTSRRFSPSIGRPALPGAVDPTPDRARRSRRARTLVALGGATLSAVILLSPMAASGQDGGPSDAQRRDEVRREKADAAASVDALRATDEELEASVRALGENLKAEQARAHDANRAADDARQAVVDLNAQVAETQRQVDVLAERVRLRAVEAYVNPNGKLDTTEEALRTDDFTGAERKAELLDAATGHDADSQEELRGARAKLTQEQDAASAAQVEAQVREAEADAQVRQVELAKEEKDRLKAALDTRIADLQAEIAALSAEEESITALIAAHEAAKAAPPIELAAAGPRTTDPAAVSTGSTPSSAVAPGGSSSPTVAAAPVTTAAPPPTGNVGRLSWPTSGSVSSGFGIRWGAMHAGIDIATPAGTPITAAAPGVVISAGGNGGGYGNLVLIDHGGGMVTAYAHQSSIVVSAGTSVGRGQLIGYVGCTGSCTGDHLHFEVRINGAAQDPMGYL